MSAKAHAWRKARAVQPKAKDFGQQPKCTCSWTRSGPLWSHDVVDDGCPWHFEQECCPGEHVPPPGYGGPFVSHNARCDQQRRVNGEPIAEYTAGER